MVDYIDRDQVILHLTEIKEEEEAQGCASFALAKMIGCIANIPSENVREQINGLWLRNKDMGFCKCSVCGDIYPYTDYVLKWHFCPNCGASMKKQ